MKPPIIVAEVSKNWLGGFEEQPTGLLAQQFERVLQVNRQRGYRLHSFQLHRVMTAPDRMNETIVAVFELVPGQLLSDAALAAPPARADE